MALVAAAVCPHPPLLVPEVGVGLDLPVRDAAQRAVADLVAAEPDLLVVVGDDPQAVADPVSYGPQDTGSLSAFGVGSTYALGPAADRSTLPAASRLPLSLTVGAWLLAGTGWAGPRRAYGLPSGFATADAAALGARIAGLDDRVALLCMGDGSARRTEKAPGWLDPRADPFDAAVARALREADPDALLALDADRAADLLVAGRASWQVLAGAAAGPGWAAELLHDEAPFGVGYLVSSWRAIPSASGRPR